MMSHTVKIVLYEVGSIIFVGRPFDTIACKYESFYDGKENPFYIPTISMNLVYVAPW